jgi:hypothetical protein
MCCRINKNITKHALEMIRETAILLGKLEARYPGSHAKKRCAVLLAMPTCHATSACCINLRTTCSVLCETHFTQDKKKQCQRVEGDD